MLENVEVDSFRRGGWRRIRKAADLSRQISLIRMDRCKKVGHDDIPKN